MLESFIVIQLLQNVKSSMKFKIAYNKKIAKRCHGHQALGTEQTPCLMSKFTKHPSIFIIAADGVIVETKEDEEVMEGEEGGGWEVEDDELELPPDMASGATPTKQNCQLACTVGQAIFCLSFCQIKRLVALRIVVWRTVINSPALSMTEWFMYYCLFY